MTTPTPPPEPDPVPGPEPEPASWQPPPAAAPGWEQPPPPAPGWGPPPPPAVDPVTGQAYSDKSRVAAGLLQLLPGFFFCLGGIGRLYAGQIGLGVAQLVSGVLAWTVLICLFWLVIPIFLFLGVWLWAVIDGIVMLAGRPVDAHGRLLRP